jgi:signal transduction histidine kinase
MASDPKSPSERYAETLVDHLSTHGEAALYHASQLGQHFVESEIGPDDIVAIHTEAIEAAISGLPFRQRAGAAVDGLQFLLEVMIAYGVHHKQYLAMRLEERDRIAEARAEADRQRARNAELADSEKSDLLRAIAHEIRTPLTAARALVQMTLRAIGSGDGERLVGLLTSALEALDRLARLSSDLAEASRGQPQELSLVELELAPILAQACLWARPQANEKAIVLSEDCPDSDARVRGETDALLSIVGNLLSNAIRYTPEGGQIRVGCDVRDTEVVISVSDSGVGMDRETVDRIFEKFYRAPEIRATDRIGLGLGLAITQQLVAAHAGRITVESTKGVGSTFRVILPLHVTSEKEHAENG